MIAWVFDACHLIAYVRDQRIDQRAVFESEMREARVDWQMNVYGNTVHSFTNPTAANAKRPNARSISVVPIYPEWTNEL